MASKKEGEHLYLYFLLFPPLFISNLASSSNPTEPLAGDTIMDFVGIDRYVTMERTYSHDSITDDQRALLGKLASITAERDKAQLELSSDSH